MTQKTDNKGVYIAPEVEAMEARVEKGFNLSSMQTDGNSSTETMNESGSAMWG